MYPDQRRELHTREILGRLEQGDPVSQRSLSRDLGIALGLTNLLLRQMAKKGWVRLRRVKKNRVRYLITPAGIAEKSRLSANYLRYSIRFYAEARNRIQSSFAALVANHEASTHLRVVFWGAAEIAEVAYVCLQDSCVVLVGVVDDECIGRRFFGHEVRSSRSVQGERLDGQPFDKVIVFPITDTTAVRNQLLEAGVPLQRVHVL